LILADLIKAALRREGVVTTYVYGDFGYGKTSYALWTAYEVYGDWEEVLKHLFFDPLDAVKVMERAVRRGERIPVMIMDDAGLWLDKLTWWEEDKVAFMQFFNLIRSVAAGVIFTVPSEDLPKAIRRKCLFRVNTRPISREEALGLAGNPRLLEKVYGKAKREGVPGSPLALATVYKRKTLPSFMEIVFKTHYDLYPLHYPIYSEYNRKRHEALKQAFARWKERLAAKKKPETEGRGNMKRLAKTLLEKGLSKAEAAKILVAAGVPRSTAYYWITKTQKKGIQTSRGR